MRYKLATALGLIATIIYFDICKDYYISIAEFTDRVVWQLSPEEILIKNFNRKYAATTPVTRSVFLGFNGNIDVILDGMSCVQSNFDSGIHYLLFSGPKFLNGISEDTPAGEDFQTLESFTQLKSTFNYFFKRQTAAERSVGDALFWKEVVQRIEEFPEKEYFIGGNAALIARTMSKNSVKVGCSNQALVHD